MSRLFAAFVLVVGARGSVADDAGAGVRIAGRAGPGFATIQAAVDAARSGNVVEIPAGQFDERLVVTKDVDLVGAGAGRTIVGPTREAQAALRERFERLFAEIDRAMRAAEEQRPRREFTAAEEAALKEKYDEAGRLVTQYQRPVVLVVGARGVELRCLGVTMPDAPRRNSGLMTTSAVSLRRAGVRLLGCTVTACVAGGVEGAEASHLEMVDCLVAGCWGPGVGGDFRQGSLRLLRCEVRNNYHNNVWVGVTRGAIEECRISGSAWFGIRCSGRALRIARNAIFENARAGIYAEGASGAVRDNLLFRNVCGAAVWSPGSLAFARNVFLENDDAAIDVHGAAQGAIRGNLFASSGAGVEFLPLANPQRREPAALDLRVEGNVFAGVGWLAARRPLRPADESGVATAAALPRRAGNRRVDGEVRLDGKQRVWIGAALAEGGPVEGAAAGPDVAEALRISLASRWPLTGTEAAMIPADGTRESSRWRMRE